MKRAPSRAKLYAGIALALILNGAQVFYNLHILGRIHTLEINLAIANREGSSMPNRVAGIERKLDYLSDDISILSTIVRERIARRRR